MSFGQNKENKCLYDRLDITESRSGWHVGAVFISHGSFCGREKPPMITSVGGGLRLEFISEKDWSTPRSGFKVKYFVGKLINVYILYTKLGDGSLVRLN